MMSSLNDKVRTEIYPLSLHDALPIFRILRLTNKKDTSLDDILKEVRKLEAPIGLNSVESMVKNPLTLSKKDRSEEHTSELQSRENLVCRLLLEKKKRQEEM